MAQEQNKSCDLLPRVTTVVRSEGRKAMDDFSRIDLDNPPFPLTVKDREVLATRDEDFQRITWDDLTNIIANNELEKLLRLPSDLRRYLMWTYNIKQQYGSITNFVIQERLHWTPLSISGPPSFAHQSSVPFEDARDFAILLNDWPYGLEEGIVHLVVWTKTPIAVDPIRGDVTAESRQLIDNFVQRHFRQDLNSEDARRRVIWFKNWVILQSVRGVDHVHVLARDVPPEVLRKWTARKDV